MLKRLLNDNPFRVTHTTKMILWKKYQLGVNSPDPYWLKHISTNTFVIAFVIAFGKTDASHQRKCLLATCVILTLTGEACVSTTTTYRLKLSLVIFWKVSGLIHVRLVKSLLRDIKNNSP